MEPEILAQNVSFNGKLAKRIILALIFMVLFDFILFPVPALAAQATAEDADFSQELNNLANIEGGIVSSTNSELLPAELFANNLPEAGDLAVKRTSYHTVTAYNSLAAQTDSTPCITANGFDLCAHGVEDSVAANWLPFGARVRMPELYGDRVFVVRDRMNAKYDNRVDIWMLEKADARNFGIKIVKIEVLDH